MLLPRWTMVRIPGAAVHREPDPLDDPAPDPAPAQAEAPDAREARLDEALDERFPASDPIACGRFS